MRIEAKLDRKLPIQLPASAYLEITKDQVGAIPDEGLRHPLGTYNVSVGSVISSANHLLDELEKIIQQSGREAAELLSKADAVRSATKQFLLANGEHVDACEKVVRCYLALKDKNEQRKAKQDLRANLDWYERHVMAQANHLKHRHSQIRSICLYTNLIAAPGYFIESQINAEAVGPDPIIHNGQNTGFSYARQLRLFICGLFYVSRSLTNVLRTHFGAIADSPSGVTQGLKELLERIAAFPSDMFPDEYQQTYPAVSCTSSYIGLNYGGLKTPKMPYQNASFLTVVGGDGVTRSFQIPYLKE